MLDWPFLFERKSFKELAVRDSDVEIIGAPLFGVQVQGGALGSVSGNRALQSTERLGSRGIKRL